MVCSGDNVRSSEFVWCVVVTLSPSSVLVWCVEVTMSDLVCLCGHHVVVTITQSGLI